MPQDEAAPPILVTGSEGFVGRWLVPALRAARPDIPLVTTTARPGPPGTTPLDITDPRAVDAIIGRCRPRAVVHLAAATFVPAAEAAPRDTFRTNLDGTLHVVRAILRDAPACRLLFASSSEVYGGSFAAGRPLDEEALLEPRNVYAASKAAADLTIGAYASQGLQAVRFRPFNHVGPGQSDRFVLAGFARQIVAAERGRQAPVIRTGNLDSRRDFLDVRDVVSAYVAAALRQPPLPPGTILNLASGVSRRIGDVLAQMITLSRVALAVEQDGARTRAHDLPLAAGDAARARTLLDWAPAIPFHQTLADLIASARSAARC